ncbi:MAG: hypothetical protein BGO98_37460 [Myxococcales bacterium 68-20]|nr:hypothetical protein [Myxococcales bacterium]OJY22279.1 MAG: hypothetical protein BGO98_37460 [Myxococcales bacterium 68-20]
MKKRWLLAIASAAITAQSAAMLTACANDGGTGDGSSDDTNTPVPVPVTDGGLDAGDADGSVCTEDCEYFPHECTEDALCSAGLFNVEAPSTGLDLRTHVHALAGRSPNDVWLAGAAGGVARFDGTSWKRSVTGTQYSLYGLWLLEGAEVAFDDPTRLYTRGLDAGADASASADGWSSFGTATLPPQWGQSTMRVEASWTYPGTRSLWIGTSTQFGTEGLWRMRYSPSDGRFAVASMNANCVVIPCKEVYGLDGVSADEVWAVGPRGAAFRVTNAESDTPTLTGFNTLTMYALHGVWAAAANDVWAVGSTGTVRRYRGDARFWETYDDLPTKQHLYAIAGSSPSDIWVAGDEGTVFHYDGTAWKRVKVAGLGARRPRLDRIWIASPGKVWIAGQGALVSLGGKP